MDNKIPCRVVRQSDPIHLLLYANFFVGTIAKRFIRGSAATAQVNVLLFCFSMTRRILKGEQSFNMNGTAFGDGHFHCVFFHNLCV